MVATSAPASAPTVWPSPTQPPTSPRWATGTRSGIAASSAASMPPKAVCTPHQATIITAALPAPASASRLIAPSTAEASTHGRRLPNREVVRSEAKPTRMVATMPNRPPTAVVSPNRPSLCAGANCSAWTSSSTCTGPECTAHTPTMPTASAAIQPARTRWTGSASASGIVEVTGPRGS